MIHQRDMGGNEMSVSISRFANVCFEIIQIYVIFTHLKLWVAICYNTNNMIFIKSIPAENIFQQKNRVFS